jgi:hypothetical protein
MKKADVLAALAALGQENRLDTYRSARAIMLRLRRAQLDRAHARPAAGLLLPDWEFWPARAASFQSGQRSRL